MITPLVVERGAIELELDVVCDVEIEIAIEVVVGECRAYTPAIVIDFGERGDIGEATLALVAEQGVATPARNVEIVVPVEVVVGWRGPHAPSLQASAATCCCVGELPSIVAK